MKTTAARNMSSPPSSFPSSWSKNVSSRLTLAAFSSRRSKYGRRRASNCCSDSRSARIFCNKVGLAASRSASDASCFNLSGSIAGLALSPLASSGLSDMLHHFHNHAPVARRFFLEAVGFDVAADQILIGATLERGDICVNFVLEEFCRELAVGEHGQELLCEAEAFREVDHRQDCYVELVNGHRETPPFLESELDRL